MPLGTATHQANSAPAAAVLHTKARGEVLVVFGAANGAIQYATLDHVRTVSEWSAAFTNPSGVTFTEVSVTPYNGPSGAVLFVVARAASGVPDEVWWGTLNGSLTWSGWTRAVSGTTPVRSAVVTPGVAAGPDGRVYMVVKALSGPWAGDLELWFYDGAGWQRPTQTQLWHGGVLNVEGRPAVLFRWHRDGNGNPLPNGALWTWYSAPDRNGETLMRYRSSRGRFNASTNTFGPALTMGRWQWPGHRTGVQVPTVAVADGVDGLTAFASYTSGEAPGITHIPYADGEATPPRLINDYNDSLTTKSSLCAALACPFRLGTPMVSSRRVTCERTP
jgi:hypothetical protein